MLPTKNYVDRPKTKSAIALMKIILKICTFFTKKHDFTRKKQQINLNFELAPNNIYSVTRYDYNVTIMKSPKPATNNGLKIKLKATFEIERC